MTRSAKRCVHNIEESSALLSAVTAVVSLLAGLGIADFYLALHAKGLG